MRSYKTRSARDRIIITHGLQTCLFDEILEIPNADRVLNLFHIWFVPVLEVLRMKRF